MRVILVARKACCRRKESGREKTVGASYESLLKMTRMALKPPLRHPQSQYRRSDPYDHNQGSSGRWGRLTRYD